ncbi:hypothetical protein [uncultured Amphritea sp.]|uniref:hypothetical protein n=1 Tax=uncultured Amphritea sp. TaxID=981605 RepID=UPI0026075A70|nr:hypothetical protein [uncultured Amphritea sp.]
MLQFSNHLDRKTDKLFETGPYAFTYEGKRYIVLGVCWHYFATTKIHAYEIVPSELWAGEKHNGRNGSYSHTGLTVKYLGEESVLGNEVVFGSFLPDTVHKVNISEAAQVYTTSNTDGFSLYENKICVHESSDGTLKFFFRYENGEIGHERIGSLNELEVCINPSPSQVMTAADQGDLF